ncbi:hypothetical protein RRG08_040645 [Elysia crispata]|uniref:Uncharacterized protein n=1 Tax=Elysia crispata TaxID=231223 RepID=A0AAE1CZJ9_9GAST|nr:hypothetical protein RRG08_040645 [Elysia crispata]
MARLRGWSIYRSAVCRASLCKSLGPSGHDYQVKDQEFYLDLYMLKRSKKYTEIVRGMCRVDRLTWWHESVTYSSKYPMESISKTDNRRKLQMNNSQDLILPQINVRRKTPRLTA